MKILIKLKWVEAKDEWHMMTPDGNLIYNFFGCENMKRIFDNPDKSKEELFIVDVRRYDDRQKNPGSDKGQDG